MPARRLAALAVALSSLLALPAFADKTIDAASAGATPDGTTLATAPLQKAIDDLSASGGGTLHFPAGKYLTGTLQLKSHVTLHLDENAILLGATDAADYKNLDPFIDGSGNPLGHALIVAIDADHVAIEGPGLIDGQGAKVAAKQKPYTIRPFLVRFVRCSNISLKDIHLANPGAWTLNFFQSKDAAINHITIRSRDQKLRNNDGINIDSSENITATDCDVVSGDDAFVVKSTAAAKPSKNITADRCKLSTHTNAIKLGTESIGGFENITVKNCSITDTDMAGIALYEVDGADLTHVLISDVTMDNVTVPISVRLGARLKTFREGDKPRPQPGHIKDVTIKNVTAKNSRLIGILMNGVPGHPIEDLTLDNVSLEVPGGGTADDANIQLPEKPDAYPEYNMFGKTLPASAMYLRHVKNLTLKNVHITPQKTDARSPQVLIDVENLTP
jgi:polygalacturonase